MKSFFYRFKAGWYILLSVVEILIAGFFLLRARSLDGNSFWLGYSFPRFVLVFLWVGVFLFSLWFLFQYYKHNSYIFPFFRKIMEIFSFREKKTAVIEWLLVFVVFTWGFVFLFFIEPEMLIFIWPSLLLLVEQYLPILFLIGLWGGQSIIFFHFRMDGNKQQRPQVITKAILLFMLAFFAYAYTATSLNLATSSKKSYFPELAESFLNGRLDLANPQSTKDLTPFDGKYYLSFPPLPALIMMPLVAWRGASAVNLLFFNDVFAALGVMFLFLTLVEIKKIGWSNLSWRENMTLAIFGGFSTALYYLTAQPLVNLVSQVLAVSFLAFSLWLTFRKDSEKKRGTALMIGTGLAMAILARPNIVFAWIAIIFIAFAKRYRKEDFSFYHFIQWCFLLGIPVVISVAFLFWYNWARFGSGFDFGYEYMLVADRLKNDLRSYGQFHPHFIWRNFYDNFLRLPYWDEKCLKITPNPKGMSIFITSPLFLYLYRTIKKEIWVIGTWISILLIGLTHILYYNSGALQYGYRFSLDYIPLLIALLAFGFRERIPKTGYALIFVGILVNLIGVLWSTHRWCINF